MKRAAINILSILIVAIVALSVIVPAIGFGYGVAEGWKTQSATPGQESIATPMGVSFSPVTGKLFNPNDTLTVDDGRKFPLVVTEAMVYVQPKSFPEAAEIISMLCVIGSFACFIAFAIVFVKFIIGINKGEIFVKRNARRLRKIAWFLIAMALLDVVAGALQESIVSSYALTLGGYVINANWTLPWSTLLLGLISMLMAEVWARGIFLKDEQDLTI